MEKGEVGRVEETNSVKETVLVPLVGRCRGVVAKFKHSDTLIRRFQALQDQFNLENCIK